MHFTAQTLSLLALAANLQSTTALGINCRGSGLCPLASWQNKASVTVMQGLRDALYRSTKPASTTWQPGQHIVCATSSVGVTNTVGAAAPENVASTDFTLSGKINSGGICVFAQGPSPVTLSLVRGLSDKLLEHGCGTCGSVPVKFLEGSNDPGPGILTYNYVSKPSCTGECLGADGNASLPATVANNTGKTKRDELVESAKFRFEVQDE